MDLKPSLQEAATRLRIDGDLLSDLQSAIDQAHDEVLVYLDRPLHPDAAARTAAIAAAQAAFDAVEAAEAAGDATDEELQEAAAALALQKSSILVTHDIRAATLLLADRLVGDNDGTERERKETAAHNILFKRKRFVC